jgi:hypothetical protein
MIGTTSDPILLKALTLYAIGHRQRWTISRLGIVDANQQLFADVIGI